MSSGVEFDEDKFSYGTPRPSSSSMPGVNNYGKPVYANSNVPSGMAGWLVRKGLVKSPNVAQVVLVVIVIVNALITLAIIKFLL